MTLVLTVEIGRTKMSFFAFIYYLCDQTPYNRLAVHKLIVFLLTCCNLYCRKYHNIEGVMFRVLKVFIKTSIHGHMASTHIYCSISFLSTPLVEIYYIITL